EERSLPYTKGYQITQSPTASVPQFLKGMRMMPTPPNASWLIVPVNTLEHFAYKHLHRERQKENYDAPLVLLRESPSTLPGRPMAMIATKNVAYSESYTGISCKRAKQPLLTALYLQAIFNSRFFLYFVLMTSSKFGCERSAFQKSDINSFPIPPIESFLQGESTNSEKMSRRVHARYAQLRTLLNELGAAALANKPTVSEIGEALVAKLYALSPADVQLVEDRLSVGLPFSQVVTAAAKATSDHDATNYGKTLSQLLTPFAAGPIDVELYPQTGSAPWRFLRVGTKGIDEPHSAHKVLAAIASADQLDCSLVEIPGTTSILIGLLNQRRYWTKTAARTLALDLIKRNHPILRSH
ncbi:MAG TPA: hypothetical protein VGV14_04620, partial [Rhodanobacter sp.]|nr:hypothetical protein [Rhodanobacter sp.]